MITAFNLDWEEEFDWQDLELEMEDTELDDTELDYENINDKLDRVIYRIDPDILKKVCNSGNDEMFSGQDQENIKKYVWEIVNDESNLQLDGDLIKKDWFPDMNADIFLSHSHIDLCTARRIKALLEYFGIKVFVDSTVWRYADDLLLDIDKNYSKINGRRYDYKKRNQTTAAVHLMLSTALTQVMDRAEAVFFLNTRNSTIKSYLGDDDNEAVIASPWIYHEIMMTKYLRDNSYKKERVKAINENIEYKNLIIARKADLSQMCKLTFPKFKDWVKLLKCKKDKCKPIQENQRSNCSSNSTESLIQPGESLNDLYSILSECT